MHLKRATFALIYGVLSGCGGDQPAALVTPVAIPSSHLPPSSTEVDASKPKTVPSALPSFLNVAEDIDARYTVRANLGQRSAPHATIDGPAIGSVQTEEYFPAHLAVLEGGEGDKARVRVICEDGGIRTAVWFDRDAFQSVTRRATFLAPHAPIPSVVTDLTPGAHLHGGVEVERVSIGSDPALVPIRVSAAYATIDGVVAAKDVGVSYVDEATNAPDTAQNLPEITAKTQILDAPHGQRFATLDPGHESLTVLKLAPPTNGFVLIRFEETTFAVVGYVRATDLKKPSDEGGTVFGIGGLGGSGLAGTATLLKRGTVLTDLASDTPIGVVTSDISEPCADACDGDAPVIKVSACSAPVQLRARLTSDSINRRP